MSALQWLMGAQTSGGSELGEAMYAASRFKDGAPDSRTAEWESLGARGEARGYFLPPTGQPFGGRPPQDMATVSRTTMVGFSAYASAISFRTTH